MGADHAAEVALGAFVRNPDLTRFVLRLRVEGLWCRVSGFRV